MKHRFLPTLVLTALMLTMPASAAQPEFPDVSREYWAYADIQKAVQYGLVQGLDDGKFNPEGTFNRASFVVILQRMFRWPDALPATPSFSDCAPGDWFYAAAETAKAHGVLTDSAAFNPLGNTSRAQMAVMLIKALGYDTLAQDIAAQGTAFPDVTDQKGHIALAAAIGMTNGIKGEDGTVSFQPNAFVTRGQAAAMLARVYERYTSKIDFLNGFYAFSSYSQIGITAKMDVVSVGWARMSWSPERGPWLNDTKEDKNDWVKPKDTTPATSFFAANKTPYNLNIYADTNAVTLADGTKTSAVAQITGTAAARTQAIAAILVEAPRYAGITIDFEGMKGDVAKADFVSFMTELRAALPKDKTLFVCVPPDKWYTGFDYRALGEVCDKVILMAHDYQFPSLDAGYIGTAKTESPVTPFAQIYTALAHITDPVTGVQNKSKIALQISFGSAGFKVDENGLLLDNTIYHPAQTTIATRLAQPTTTVVYDPHHRNPCMTYLSEDGARYKLWYEDTRSVMDKLDLARMFGITGVSLWRIGNIPSYPAAGLNYDVWNAILQDRP